MSQNDDIDTPTVIERLIQLPCTQLRISVRIWNADPTTIADGAASSVSHAAAVAIPIPRPHDTHLVLIHGWLDNSASWDPLIPLLVKDFDAAKRKGQPKNTDGRLVCYCLELSGHGNSDHRSSTGSYHPSEHAIDMIQAIRMLGIPDGYFLGGHSLGAAVTYIMSTSLGNRISGLILFDSIGPWVSPTWMSRLEDPSILRLATALQEHTLTNRKRVSKLYPSKEAILKRYIGTNPFMEQRSAQILAERAVKEVMQHSVTHQQVDISPEILDSEQLPSDQWRRGWVFKHDSRLISTALMTPVEENTLAAFRSITSPVLIFLATNTLRKQLYSTQGRDPRIPTHWILLESNPTFPGIMAKRIASFPNECTFIRVEGDHHIHMDSTSTADISRDMVAWMMRAPTLHQPITPIPGVREPTFFSQPQLQAKL